MASHASVGRNLANGPAGKFGCQDVSAVARVPDFKYIVDAKHLIKSSVCRVAAAFRYMDEQEFVLSQFWLPPVAIFDTGQLHLQASVRTRLPHNAERCSGQCLGGQVITMLGRLRYRIRIGYERFASSRTSDQPFR